SGDGFFGAKRTNCHVEIARAVADAMTSPVEGSKGNNENVRRNLRRLRHWLTDSPLATSQGFAKIPGADDQRPAAASDGGQRKTRTGVGKLVHQRDRVDFAPHRREPGHNRTMLDLQWERPGGNRLGCRSAHSRRQRVANSKSLLSKLRFL